MDWNGNWKSHDRRIRLAKSILDVAARGAYNSGNLSYHRDAASNEVTSNQDEMEYEVTSIVMKKYEVTHDIHGK